MRPRSVAIVGQMASGKTTLANQLIKDYGYVQVSFARRLKDIAAAIYNDGQPIDKSVVYYATHEAGAPRPMSGRQLLQELGQSVKSFDRDLWVRWLKADLDSGLVYPLGQPFVIDDCRFPYEANFLRDEMGFVIVKLDTPDDIRFQRYERLYGRQPSEAERNHPSETQVEAIAPDLVMPGNVQASELARLVMRSI